MSTDRTKTKPALIYSFDHRARTHVASPASYTQVSIGSVSDIALHVDVRSLSTSCHKSHVTCDLNSCLISWLFSFRENWKCLSWWRNPGPIGSGWRLILLYNCDAGAITIRPRWLDKVGTHCSPVFARTYFCLINCVEYPSILTPNEVVVIIGSLHSYCNLLNVAQCAWVYLLVSGASEQHEPLCLLLYTRVQAASASAWGEWVMVVSAMTPVSPASSSGRCRARPVD